MSRLGAQTAVSLSAFVVAVIFAYRKLTEDALPNKSSPSTAHFVIGFGFTYVTLALVAQSAPSFGGMLAVLVATGDTLVNGQALLGDVQKGLTSTAAANRGGGSPTNTAALSPSEQATASAGLAAAGGVAQNAITALAPAYPGEQNQVTPLPNAPATVASSAYQQLGGLF